MKMILFVALLWWGAITGLYADPVIKFDDLPSFTTVPPAYHLLNWNGFACADWTQISGVNGFHAGVISDFNMVYPLNGSTASISAGMFDFVSVYATAAYNDNLQLEAKGYIKGTLVFDQTNTLSATAPTLIQYNFYGVDEVDFVSSGGTLHPGYTGSGTHFVFDNLSVVTYVPYSPSFITNGGFELGSFSGWSRSGNTNNWSVVTDANYLHSGTYGAKLGPTSPGFLGQTIVPTEIGRRYTVSFWLNNLIGGANSFAVNWNGTPVFGLTNTAAFAFTNIQFDVVAWRLSEFLQFQFENDPAYFGLDDISVTPSVLVSNGGFEVAGYFSGWTLSGNTNEATMSLVKRVGQEASAFGEVQTLGFISQSIITQPGQPYLISSWLEINQLLTVVSTNEFQVSWGGKPVLDLTNLPIISWTNIHVIGLNGNSQNTLQFGFRNDPGFTFFDEVSVYPVPLLVNGGFEFGDFTGWTQSGNVSKMFVNTNKTYLNSGFYGAQMAPGGSLGYLSQNVATVPGQTYLIGFTLYNPTSMTNAEFTVSWNGAILMDTTNLFFTGQLPFEFPVTAPGTNSIVQFGFRNDPQFFGFDDAFVSPIPAPVLQFVSRDTNNLVNLSWSALPGYQYDLQYTTNLALPNWTDLQGFRFPTNFPMQGTDTNPPDAERFYRVKLAPPPLIL